MQKQFRMGDEEIEKYFDPEVRRVTVITTYGKTRSYQINGITFETTPENYSLEFSLEKHLKEPRRAPIGGEDEDEKMDLDPKPKQTIKGTCMDYFKMKYNIDIRYPHAPMAIINVRGMEFYIPTEVIHPAQLPEDFTKNVMAMRDLQKYKIADPQARIDRILKLM